MKLNNPCFARVIWDGGFDGRSREPLDKLKRLLNVLLHTFDWIGIQFDLLSIGTRQ